MGENFNKKASKPHQNRVYPLYIGLVLLKACYENKWLTIAEIGKELQQRFNTYLTYNTIAKDLANIEVYGKETIVLKKRTVHANRSRAAAYKLKFNVTINQYTKNKTANQ